MKKEIDYEAGNDFWLGSSKKEILQKRGYEVHD
jgi:hypothetical protein